MEGSREKQSEAEESQGKQRGEEGSKGETMEAESGGTQREAKGSRRKQREAEESQGKQREVEGSRGKQEKAETYFNGVDIHVRENSFHTHAACAKFT